MPVSRTKTFQVAGSEVAVSNFFRSYLDTAPWKHERTSGRKIFAKRRGFAQGDLKLTADVGSLGPDSCVVTLWMGNDKLGGVGAAMLMSALQKDLEAQLDQAESAVKGEFPDRPAAVQSPAEAVGAKFCSSCGSPCSSGARFCQSCGAAIGGAPISGMAVGARAFEEVELELVWEGQAVGASLFSSMVGTGTRWNVRVVGQVRNSAGMTRRMDLGKFTISEGSYSPEVMAGHDRAEASAYLQKCRAHLESEGWQETARGREWYSLKFRKELR